MNGSTKDRKEYYRLNREHFRAAARERNNRVATRRRELLSQFSCISCGESDPTVIQWHHLDPSEKESYLHTHGLSEDKFWNEVLKCIPVCANCHVKIHKETLCLLPMPL